MVADDGTTPGDLPRRTTRSQSSSPLVARTGVRREHPQRLPAGTVRVAFVLTLLATMSAGLSTGCVSGVSQSRPARPDTATTLVGTWRLVSFESRTTGGEIRHQLGRAPRGQLLYDVAGHMSAQLMDPERSQFASGDLARGSDTEVRAAMVGYIAYYGTYTLDLSRGVVTHHVQGALFPNWVGGDQVRYFKLDGNWLTITTPPIRIGGEDSTTVLVWERAP